MNPSNPCCRLVSIILPAHEAFDEVHKHCLLSIASQSYNNIEVCLFASNAAYHSLSEWLRYYRTNVPYPLKLLSSPLLVTPGKARRELLAISTGVYNLFLDSDDILEDECVERKVELAYKHSLDIVFSDAYVSSRSCVDQKKSSRSYILPLLISKYLKLSCFRLILNPYPNCSTLITRKNNDRISIDYPTIPHEDFIFYSRLMSRPGVKCGVLRSRLVTYTYSEHNLTSNKLKSRIWHYNSLRRISPGTAPLYHIMLTIVGALVLLLLPSLSKIPMKSDESLATLIHEP